MNKKQKFLIIDTETANSVENPLVYDIGFAVADNNGTIYETQSFLVRDIFELEKDLMATAYYAEKIPLYLEKLQKKEIRLADLQLIQWIIKQTIEKYNIKAICAYNASFDLNALNNTIRYITKSKRRYFFPYGTEINCIWHMACQVLYTQKRFYNFVLENGFLSPNGNILTSAEVGFRYLQKDIDFQEEHTGLADVLIETAIMAKCYAQHKHMKKNINRGCYWIPNKLHKG